MSVSLCVLSFELPVTLRLYNISTKKLQKQTTKTTTETTILVDCILSDLI